MSRTRYEWTLLDFAIWSAGAVTVPVYETSSAEQIQWILGDSGAVACRRGAATRTRRPSSRCATGCPRCKHVWQIERRRASSELRPRRRGRHRRDGRGAQRARRRPTTRRPSSTPPAPPAAPRAVCSPTAASSPSAATSWSGCARCSVPASARCCSSCPLAHVFGRLVQVAADDGADQAGPRPGHQEPHRRTGLVPADADPRRAARLREGLQLGAGQGAGGRQGQDLRQGGGHGDRLQPRAGHPVGPVPRPEGASTRSSTGSSTASCARSSAAAASTPSPAAPRSASGSATSSAASASRSWRATA